MPKKVLSLVTAVSFVLFDWACLSIQKVPVTSVTSKDQIVGVTKISGEYVQIPQENPARIVENQIVLTPSNTITMSDVKEFRETDKEVVYEITTKDGRTIRDVDGKREGGKIVFRSLIPAPASILLSEVNLVSVLRLDAVMTILIMLGVIGGGIYVSYLIILNSFML